MCNWKEFELKCTRYLNENFGKYAIFCHQGGSNSKVSDIEVKTNKGTSFYIEVKKSPAQCGQFVLLRDNGSRTFIYSGKNAFQKNTYAEQIIEHMNARFDEYKEPGRGGVDVNMENGPEIFSNWIIDTYKKKDVLYFITDNFTIVPIERLGEYFHVSAKYRIKISGSGDVGKKNISDVLECIKSLGYDIESTRTEGGKLFVVSKESLHGKRFTLEDREYMFSRQESEYEIKKLSNTANANVIFSIKLKSNVNGIGADEFIRALI